MPTSLPVSNRKAGVQEKLSFAQTQYMSLMQEVIRSYQQDDQHPRFIGQIAESVLSNTRECFDHLGTDILEAFVLPHADQSFRKSFSEGKVNTYFPYYKSQLTQAKLPFAKLKTACRPLYDELEMLTEAIQTNLAIAGRNEGLRKLATIREMVNEKKHSHVLKYEGLGQKKFFYERKSDGLVCVLTSDFRGKLTHKVEGLDSASLKPVPSYRFVNGEDVWHLCGFAVGTTAWVMNRIYGGFFAPTQPIELQDTTPSFHVLPPSPLLSASGESLDPRPLLQITKPGPTL